jgi:hypothetical protein
MASGSGALAQQPAKLVLPSGGVLRFSTRGDRTVVDLPAIGRRKARELLLERDATVAPHAPVLNLRMIAESGVVVVLADSYASKPGGASYCQAGVEQFLRVIAGGKETFRIKLQSCLENLELGAQGVTWDAANSMVRIDWLGKSASFRVDGTGKVIPIP